MRVVTLNESLSSYNRYKRKQRMLKKRMASDVAVTLQWLILRNEK
jgi:hypothetical protein